MWLQQHDECVPTQPPRPPCSPAAVLRRLLQSYLTSGTRELNSGGCVSSNIAFAFLCVGLDGGARRPHWMVHFCCTKPGSNNKPTCLVFRGHCGSALTVWPDGTSSRMLSLSWKMPLRTGMPRVVSSTLPTNFPWPPRPHVGSVRFVLRVGTTLMLLCRLNSKRRRVASPSGMLGLIRLAPSQYLCSSN